jgi:hypothetical protein
LAGLIFSHPGKGVRWLGTIAAISGQVGSAFTLNLDSLTVAPAGQSRNYTIVSGALPAGLSLAGSQITGTPTAQGTVAVNVRVSPATGGETRITTLSFNISPAAAVSSLLLADYVYRRSGPGVVWHHDFESDDEVNNFRWCQGYNSGNDPLNKGNLGGQRNNNTVYRQPADGLTGACMEIVRRAGITEGQDWWRPFSPMLGGTTTGNGRGSSNPDPGANGTITRNAWTPTDGGAQTAGWGLGVYGNKAGGGPYDGNEFFLQARIKCDPRRQQGPKNINVDSGKLCFFTRCDRSNGSQEVVPYGGTQGTTPNTYFRMYRQSGFHLDDDPSGVASTIIGNQPGSDLGICKIASNAAGSINNCWHFINGQWDTVEWRFKPGDNGATALGSDVSGNNTEIDVWAANDGQAPQHIWHQTQASISYDVIWGYAAWLASIYHNGSESDMDEFCNRYCQVMFSKSWIGFPLINNDGVNGSALAKHALAKTANA